MGWRLTRIEDQRAYDWATDQPLPLSEDAVPCDHCGQPMPVLFFVLDISTGEERAIAPEHLLDAIGWQPSSKALLKAQRRFAREQERARAEQLRAQADALVDQIRDQSPSQRPRSHSELELRLEQLLPGLNQWAREIRDRAEARLRQILRLRSAL